MTIARAVPLLAVLLAACAPDAPGSGAGRSPFDGVYAGTYELTGGQGPCNKAPKPAEMTVAQGTMSLAYSPRDNVFFKQAVPAGGAVQVKGKFDGDGFTGETANASCTYRVVLKRK